MNAKDLTIDDLDALLAKAGDPKAEAIANADAHTNNAGLPTYSELVAALKFLRGDCVAGVAADGYTDLREPGRKSFNETGALLARIPA